MTWVVVLGVVFFFLLVLLVTGPQLHRCERCCHLYYRRRFGPTAGDTVCAVCRANSRIHSVAELPVGEVVARPIAKPSGWTHTLVEKRPTIKQMIEGHEVEEFTCFDCCVWHVCPFAFDAYNTNGDCLAEK